MKNILLNIFVSVLISAFFISCLGNSNDPVQVSNPSVAPFVSLIFTKNDSIPNLETAKFVIQYQDPEQLMIDLTNVNVDSLIVNLDSLPMGTPVNVVVAQFYFDQYPSSAYAIYTDNFDKKLLMGDGTDTLNFTRPMIIQVTSHDGSNKFYYRMKVNVHKVIPYLYNWNHATDNIPAQYVDNQFTTVFNNQFFYYINYNNNGFLYNANTSYSELINASLLLENMPQSLNLQSIKFFNNKLYLFSKEDNKIYSTSDGYVWTAADFSIPGYSIESLIMNYQDKLWGIVKDATDYYSTFSIDGINWQIGDILPDNFPVSQFAAVPNSNHIANPKAYVYGGLTRDGEQSTKAFSTENGLSWIEFQPFKSTPLLSVGMSIVSYDNKLLMFGGNIDSTFVQVSVDEGFSWSQADTTAIKVPADFTLRTFQSVFVDDDNRIVIVGGKDSLNNSLTDIWTIKLNSIDWQ